MSTAAAFRFPVAGEATTPPEAWGLARDEVRMLVAAPDLPERQRTEWHANTGKEVTAAAIGGYIEGLDPWELRLFEFVAGSRLRRLGYDAPSRPAVPRLTALARYAQKLLLLRLKTRVLIVRDRWIARRSGPMADQGPA